MEDHNAEPGRDEKGNNEQFTAIGTRKNLKSPLPAANWFDRRQHRKFEKISRGELMR